MRTLFALAMVALSLPACGSDPPPPDCTGSSCTCPDGTSCDLSGSTCASQSCSLDCGGFSDCSGTCGDSCSIDCTGGSACDLTLGDSGSITCDDGAVCHVVCTGSCSVTCSGDSQCDLQCAGDPTPRSIPEGGSCEGPTA